MLPILGHFSIEFIDFDVFQIGLNSHSFDSTCTKIDKFKQANDQRLLVMRLFHKLIIVHLTLLSVSTLLSVLSN